MRRAHAPTPPGGGERGGRSPSCFISACKIGSASACWSRSTSCHPVDTVWPAPIIGPVQHATTGARHSLRCVGRPQHARTSAYMRELAYWTECASPSVRVHASVRGSMLVNRAVGRQAHLHSAVVLECERGRWLDGMCRSARSGASCCFSPSLFLFRQSPGRR